jgi:HlyD family secretion protein
MDIQRKQNTRSQWRGPVLLVLTAALFVVLIVIAIWMGKRSPSVDRDSIWTGTVTRGELLHEAVASGRLVAPEIRAVTNRAAGVVEQVRMLPGAVVGPDDVLLVMASPQIDEDLAAAHWELAEVRARHLLDHVESQNRRLDMETQVAVAESDYSSTQMEFEAQQQLGAGQVFSSLEVERTRLRAIHQKKRLQAERTRLERYDQVQQAELEAAAARLGAMEDRVARLEALQRDLEVRAGMSGVVLEITPEEGQQLTAGTAIARIVNPEHLIARVAVDERSAARVRQGLPATLELGRDRLDARVTRVDPGVTNRMVEVDLELADGAEAFDLRPDLSLTARIELERVDDTLKIGRPAQTGGEAGTMGLFRLDASGKRAKRVQVQLGRASLREVEVLSGLAVGDRVILTDMSAWLDQEQIRIR